MNRHFNLIEEPWLLAEGVGEVSLRRIFTDPTLTFLGGTPVEKIAAMNLLLAIVQSAVSLETEDERCGLSTADMAKQSLAYLEARKDLFDLYGEKPFLQVPGAVKAQVRGYTEFLLERSTGHNAVIRSAQVARTVTDAEKARVLLRLQGFAHGGHRTDNSVWLSEGETKKTTCAVPGPSLGARGHLHTFVLRRTLWESLKHNLFTKEDMAGFRTLPEGIGTAPWDAPITAEECENALRLKESLMGRLVPMSRLCLLAENGIHCTEGVRHPGRKDGIVDPSASIKLQGKDGPETLWVDPARRPWRMLPAMLQFLSGTEGKGFSCPRLRMGLDRAGAEGFVRIWSGGLSVSSTSAEQIIKDGDDYVESVIDTNYDGELEPGFIRFGQEMKRLEDLGTALFAAVRGYYRALEVQDSPKARQAVSAFWHAAEEHASELLALCETADKEAIKKLRFKFFRLAEEAFSAVCPSRTPRQITAWVNNRLSGRKYLKD